MEGTVSRVWKPGSLRGAYAISEGIAAKDLSNLYRTSCYFSDLERYQAFCAFYAIMRVTDDWVDEVIGRRKVSAEEKRQGLGIVRAWHRVVLDCLAGHSPTARDAAQIHHPDTAGLLRCFAMAVKRFPVPAVLWDNFFAAMHQDLLRQRFSTYKKFVDYAEGAAVAPATIYLYFIAAEQGNGGDAFRTPRDFALIQCGRKLGLFAYIAHILRDLAEDLAAGEQGLWYLAADDMAAHGLTEEMLLSDLASGSASPPLRSLVRELVERAQSLVGQGRACLRVLEGRLSPDRAFVLELIIRTYEAVLEKIASCSHDVMADHHRLTEAEKERIALEVAVLNGSL